MKTLFRALVGVSTVSWAAVVSPTDDPIGGQAQEHETVFELCNSCVSKKDFVSYAKFMASSLIGEHVVMIGNTKTGDVYKIAYSVPSCSASDWNCNISIGSVEFQSEATRRDFMEMVRAFQK